jgi:hypothetical protein
MATAAIRAYTRQTISQVVDDVLTVRGTADPELLLPQRPVSAVSAVTLDGAAADYTFDGIGTLTRSDGWAGLVAVTYTHGYATVPDDVFTVCLQAAARVYGNPEGLANESIDDHRAGFGAVGAQLTDDEKEMLRPYRRRHTMTSLL